MKIVVEKMYDKPIEWMGCPKCRKKVCEHGLTPTLQKSTAYTAMADGKYYRLKGWGSDRVREGDVIEGELSSYEYTNKNGETRTGYDLFLSKPVDMIVDDVYKLVKHLSIDEWNKVADEVFKKMDIPEEEVITEDIPF